MKITEFLEAHGAKVWTKGTGARDSGGEVVQPSDEEAVCFCAYGLIERFYTLDGERGEKAVLDLMGVVGDRVADWNDDPATRFEDVLSAFRKAGL